MMENKNSLIDDLCKWKVYFICAFFLFQIPYDCFAENTTPPTLIITSFTINNVEHKYDSVFQLQSDENNIRITYEGVDLSFSGDVTYLYRLKSDGAWDSTKETTINLPALNAGNYSFSVKAKTSTSNWSPAEHINFSIAKPLYARWWFIITITLLTGGSIFYLVYTNNKKYLMRQKQAFIIQQKMNDMENQAKQAMMNPHFVFNALNSIQHYMLDNDKQSANKYLTKFSRLIRMNLDLSTKTDITLEEEFEKLKLYLEIEQLRFGEKLTYDFNINAELETDEVYMPSMILQPFVENAIWHGIMPADKIGKITVSANSINNEKQLQITILDNGIGITNSKNMSKPQTHNSIGIQLTVDRIKLFSSQHNSEGIVTIEDDLKTGGTCVTIILPLIKKLND